MIIQPKKYKTKENRLINFKSINLIFHLNPNIWTSSSSSLLISSSTPSENVEINRSWVLSK